MIWDLKKGTLSYFKEYILECRHHLLLQLFGIKRVQFLQLLTKFEAIVIALKLGIQNLVYIIIVTHNFS